MTLKIFVLTLSLSSVYAAGFSQATMSVTFSNQPLETVLDYLEQNSEYTFVYRKGILEGTRVKEVNLANVTIEQVLEAVLSENGFTYHLTDNQIIVVRKETLQQPRGTLSIKGVIKDKDNNPIPGAGVIVKGSHQGTATNRDGNFSLTVTGNPNPVLLVSFLGKKSVEFPYQGEQPLTIILEEDVTIIDDVVVTGIFTKARESYTGAVRTIGAAELGQAGNRSVLSSISNIDPSFNIITDLAMGSDPNNLPNINMRGNASLTSNVRDLQNDSRFQDESNSNLPLFILDGFEISLERMMDLNESIIETITILKDASATAMYGSRGANGIIVITSKKPEIGRLSVMYTGQLSIEAPDLTSYNMMNASEKLEFENYAGLYYRSSWSTQMNEERQLLYNERLMNVLRGVDTYWLKYPVETGVGHKHNVRIEGGSEVFRYATGVQYNNIEGAMKGSRRNTLNGNMFLSYNAGKFTFQNDLQVGTNRSYNSPYGKFSNWTTQNSYYKPYDDEGNLLRLLERYAYIGMSAGTNTVTNPLYDALLPGKDESRYTTVKNNFLLEWRILPELSLRGRFTIETRNYRDDLYKSSEHSDFFNYTEENYDRRGTYTMGFQESSGYETDFTLNFNKTFRDVHQLYAGLRYELADHKSETYSFTAEGISNPQTDFMGMASAYQKEGSPYGLDAYTRRLGGTANVNYTYDRRYFVDFSGTIDASSKFGSNNRAAPFWSTGIGWNIHQEHFFNPNDIISNARARLSYGTSGNQNFDTYQALRTYRNYGDVNYNGWYGSYLMALGNDDLGWQKTKQANLGFDLTLLQNRLQINVDLYHRMTNDMLADITLPSAGGFTSYKANLGKVENKGIEVDLNAHIIRNTASRFSWSVGAALRHNKNTIKEISESLRSLNEQLMSQNSVKPSYLFQEGKSTSTFYAVQSMGIDPSNGKEIYRKLDGTLTYVWDSKDQIACGDESPKYWGTLSTLVRFRNFSLNAIFGYQWGGQMYNSTLVNKVENIFPYQNADKRALYDRWQKEGDIANFVGIAESSARGDKTSYATSRFAMDHNELSLRTLKLSYDFTQEWMKAMSLRYLSVSASTENLFVVSSIKQERGTAYPFSRKFYFTLTARF